MNILRQELRFQTKSIIIWVATFVLLLVVFMGIFPAFAKEAATLKLAMAAFPREMFDSIGMDIDRLFEASGFVSYIYGLIQLFLAIMGALYGFDVVNREKIARMNDFLYVKPIARLSVFGQKVAAALIGFAIMNGVLFATFQLMAGSWTIDSENLLLINQIILGGFLLQLLVFALAALFGQFMRRIKNPVGSATALSFTLFLILMVGRLMDDDLIKNLTPFGYVQPLEIITNGLSLRVILAFSGLTLLLLGISAWLLSRRDLEV